MAREPPTCPNGEAKLDDAASISVKIIRFGSRFCSSEACAAMWNVSGVSDLLRRVS